jgi:hypothetical protein
MPGLYTSGVLVNKRAVAQKKAARRPLERNLGWRQM